MPPKTPEVALKFAACPVELSNVYTQNGPIMHKNMQIETQNFLGCPLLGPLRQWREGYPSPYSTPILSAPAAPLYCRAFSARPGPQIQILDPLPPTYYSQVQKIWLDWAEQSCLSAFWSAIQKLVP